MKCRRESLGYPSIAATSNPPIANRRYCVVNHDVTLDQYAKRSCSSGLHIHCSAAEISDLLAHNAIEDLPPKGDARRGYVYRFKRQFAVRGLSARFGEELAHMMARDDGRSMAQFLLSEIRRRHVSPDREQAEGPIAP